MLTRLPVPSPIPYLNIRSQVSDFRNLRRSQSTAEDTSYSPPPPPPPPLPATSPPRPATDTGVKTPGSRRSRNSMRRRTFSSDSEGEGGEAKVSSPLVHGSPASDLRRRQAQPQQQQQQQRSSSLLAASLRADHVSGAPTENTESRPHADGRVGFASGVWSGGGGGGGYLPERWSAPPGVARGAGSVRPVVDGASVRIGDTG